jgi:hypothetical protein
MEQIELGACCMHYLHPIPKVPSIPHSPGKLEDGGNLRDEGNLRDRRNLRGRRQVTFSNGISTSLYLREPHRPFSNGDKYYFIFS